MAEHGLEAATLARVVQEAGIPMSSVYHYYGSKEGILLAVMERGADRFFADLPDLDRRPGDPAWAQEHLARVVSAAVRTLERHPDFLRLLIVFAAQPPAAGDGEIQAVVRRVREHALDLLRSQIAVAFCDEPRSAVTDQLARFALAAPTARSWPARPTPGSRSSGCSGRCRPRSWRRGGRCWLKRADDAAVRTGRKALATGDGRS